MHFHLDCNYLFIFFYVTVLFCYGSFYQAIAGTGLAWVCLSSRTWRGAPLLDVDFPLLIFDLKFSPYPKFFWNIFFSLLPLIYMYTLVPLYHEMKTNKLGPTCEFNMRKNHIACSSKIHNGKILKWMRVESRHQTRSLVSLVDDGVLLLIIAFWLDEREKNFNTSIKVPWISSKINYKSVYPSKPGSLAGVRTKLRYNVVACIDEWWYLGSYPGAQFL